MKYIKYGTEKNLNINIIIKYYLNTCILNKPVFLSNNICQNLEKKLRYITSTAMIQDCKTF